MPATPPLEPPVGTIKPADDDDIPTVSGANYTVGGPDTLPLDTIKAAIKERVDVTSLRLDDLRRERDLLNANVKTARAKVERDIRDAVAELAEAKRIANSLTPRKPRTKKAPK